MFLLLCSRLVKIKEWVDAHDPGAVVIPVSGAIESKLLDMEEEERNKYCEEQKTQRWVTGLVQGKMLFGLDQPRIGISLCFASR